MKNIVCVGRAVWDHIFTINCLPLLPGKVSALQYKEVGGGPAATAAVAISKLGGNAILWCNIGDDNTGKNILQELKLYGVDISEICITPGAQSPVATVLVDANGERAIAAYSDKSLCQSTNVLPKAFPGNTNMVLADTKWPEGALHTLTIAQKQSIPSLLDIEKTDFPHMEGLTSLATYAVFSEDGLKSFSNELDLEVALYKAANVCRGTVCVTLGDRGCMWLDKTIIKSQPSYEVEVVDTTGAGDVFHGALASYLCQSENFEKAVQFASATAALKCTKQGGREGIPSKTTISKFLGWN